MRVMVHEAWDICGGGGDSSVKKDISSNTEVNCF